MEYKPAPTTSRAASIPFGPNDIYPTTVLKTATEKINGDFQSTNNGLSLGTLGRISRASSSAGDERYRTARFPHRLVPQRQFYPAPGIVYVAFDQNGDGQPNDDEWYELAGSEYGKTGNRTGIKIVYDRPDNFNPSVNYGTGVDNYITYTINDNEPGSLA
ncbi:MAG: hypothetical protein ACLVK4_12125 [Alistipes shahii]|uniref:hypothetical protein n=1 Tax=Alistipes shahii TaxID=328814 RepID=UPI00399CE91A